MVMLLDWHKFRALSQVCGCHQPFATSYLGQYPPHMCGNQNLPRVVPFSICEIPATSGVSAGFGIFEHAAGVGLLFLLRWVKAQGATLQFH